jgi:hypothetical protein
MNFQFHKMRGISGLAEELSALDRAPYLLTSWSQGLTIRTNIYVTPSV